MTLATGKNGASPSRPPAPPQAYDPLDEIGLIGHSREFQHVRDLIQKLSQFDAPLLVLGETGTGKERAARAIHYLGTRQNHPFIPVNCGALPDTLVENELFGHASGAFTDAKGEQPGLIAQADGGTLFLDEVDTLSPRAQVTLLRFLQDQNYRPLGGKKFIRADVRVMAASNRDLHALVRKGSFRQDLLFRLDILDLVLPPLRQREHDIETLSLHFLERYRLRYNLPTRSLHPETLEWMRTYHWPGNIRELENFLHRACLLADGDQIRVAPLSCSVETGCVSEGTTPGPITNVSFQEAKAQAIEEFEVSYLSALIIETGGNITEAARRSGKERRSLARLLKKHGIDRTQF
ncbi:Sigma-54 dependent transcriptional regulator [Nitrospina gracilis 3/211]|uniref:Sigma-54 dependent transcriptional regulator n=1 Tax=Nitrospina gracilis (strain 3/211) TaxID=1266370 RepID=M1YY39_NITG3|nr:MULTISPECIES: sigma-54 dependent transcriptional regulator [Nitrospina]MCF8723367.1 DNA-binding NtrC family response regulator [Nitrospina sp. Nb-3]CCQ90422.1 Sigma-54 dependent transcriptional regulator [Nitrospina gracilis 3/211]